MAAREFRLPDVGEGLTEAELVTWRVAPGDTVAVNDPLCDIETAKSLVELPSPWAGTVDRLLVPPGETVPVGTPIIAIADVGQLHDRDPRPVLELHDRQQGEGEPSTAAGAKREAEPKREAGVEPKREAVLVGYGPRTGAVRSRRKPSPPIMQSQDAPPPPIMQSQDASTESIMQFQDGSATSIMQRPHGKALAKPPVRKLARDLGVDLAAVTPTGDGGVVTRADVEAFAAVPEPRQGGGRREPVKGVRKATAAAMVASAFTAPHVTLWVAVDCTRSVKLVRRLREDPAFEGARVSPLTLAARAVLVAARRHPGITSRWAGDEIVTPEHVDLGIAVAAPRGLLVPAVRRADTMTLPELAHAITGLTATARAGKATPADLAGGTLSITNVGVFGVDGGTPILNPGEPAILALGRVTKRPWVHKDRIRARDVVELSLSVDHRVVDGELAGRFLADVAAILEDPARLVAWG